MSVNLLCYMDEDGELTFYEEGSQNEALSSSDLTLTRIPAADVVVSDDLSENETTAGTIINYSKLYKAYTNSQLNVNQNTPVTVDYKSAEISSYDSTVFTPVTNGVQILKDLKNVTIISSVYIEDNVGQRSSVGISININGSPSTVEGLSYIRRASTSNEDSPTVIETFPSLSAGDVITATVIRRAVASTNTNSIEDKGILSVLGFVPTNAASISGFPEPIITSIEPLLINSNTTTDIIIKGGYFTEASTVSIPGITVNNIVSFDDDELIVNITTGTDNFHTIEVSNESGTKQFPQQLEVKTSTWVDLRLGGNAFTDGNAAGNDIRYQNTLSLSRDSNGMFFDGANPWTSWVKFESLQWNRGENKTLQWIFTNPSAAMMIGIGSDATVETSTSQFSQMEIEAYFNAATSFWGLYGNNGTIGGAGNQNNTTAISTNSFFKIKFEGDGSVGSVFTLYELSNGDPSNWDDESNIITSLTVGGTLNPDESILFPCIIPRSASTQRFIALKVE